MTELMETALKRAKMLRTWRTWAQRIAEVVRDMMPDAQVYVTGSVVRGDYVGKSDVDILIISQRVPRRAVDRGKFKELIEDRLGLPFYHPFEIHLLTPEEAQIYLEKARGDVERIA